MHFLRDYAPVRYQAHDIVAVRPKEFSLDGGLFVRDDAQDRAAFEGRAVKLQVLYGEKAGASFTDFLRAGGVESDMPCTRQHYTENPTQQTYGKEYGQRHKRGV